MATKGPAWLWLTFALTALPPRSPAVLAQGITRVTTQNVVLGTQITVNYENARAGYWIGVSIRAPNGREIDLPPSQVRGSGSVSFRTADAPCDNRKLPGYSLAVAMWSGYDRRTKKMTGLVSRFTGTTWISLACPRMYGI
ncbi:MAG: hypothetical protein HY700_16865 [Gemmatimonadetes bacterium]|nr:hypothetical protein [Gemmatimonadota bacterium]